MDLGGAARAATIVLGATWSAGLLLTGLWLWHVRGQATMLTTAPAVAAVAAGWFVWMYLVADDLCPRASPIVTGLAKLAAGLVFWSATALTVAGLIN